MKKNIYKIIGILILSLIIIPTNRASASTVYLESSRTKVAVGDTIVVVAKINADGSVLNTVDGEIAIKGTRGDGTVKEFSLSNSAFGLWPRTPSLSTDNHTVAFVAGVPGGFSIEGATLFKMIIEATKEGTISISPQNISVYKNDGLGTKIPVKIQGINIDISKKASNTSIQNDWAKLVSSDTTPPNDFIVVLGQDKDIFDGKKFAYFSAVDNQSGIEYYEVSENGMPPVRSGSTYVLQNQDGKVQLTVTAYDKAHNKKVSTYTSTTTTQNIQYEGNINWLKIILIIIIISILIIFTRKFILKK